jgi:uncharacterized membrane protein YjjP (DUF1212 family)
MEQIITVLFVLAAFLLPFFLLKFTDWGDKIVAFVTGAILSLISVFAGGFTTYKCMLDFPFRAIIAFLFYWVAIALVRKLLQIRRRKATIPPKH